MRLRFLTPLFVVIACCVRTPSAEAAIPIIWGQGATVAKIADLPPGHPLLAMHGPGTAVGYKYERFHVYWCDLWTWNGEFCLYNDQGHLPLGTDAKKAAQLAGMTELHKPLLYYFPLGWIVIAGLVFGSFVLETMKKRNAPEARVARLLLDPDYQDAAKLLTAFKDGEDRAIDHLIGRGIDLKTAQNNVKLLADQCRIQESLAESEAEPSEAQEADGLTQGELGPAAESVQNSRN